MLFLALDQSLSVLKYDEYDSVNKLSKVQFLKQEVLNRFNLVGGKIRLLIHNEIGFSMLKNQVFKSIYAVSVEKLRELDSFDIHGNTPSIIYSFTPTSLPSALPTSDKDTDTDCNIEYDPRQYRLSFASWFVSYLVASRINFGRFFAAMKDQKIGSSLVGQIFESLIINGIISFKIRRLIGKSLESSTEPELEISFNDFLVKKYDSSKSTPENYTSNTLFLPIQMNAPSVDAVFIDINLNKIYFLQINISSNHPVKYEHLIDLARKFNVTSEEVELVYLVPAGCIAEFRKQSISKGKTNAANIEGFKQSVMYVPIDEYSANDFSSILNLI